MRPVIHLFAIGLLILASATLRTVIHYNIHADAGYIAIAVDPSHTTCTELAELLRTLEPHLVSSGRPLTVNIYVRQHMVFSFDVLAVPPAGSPRYSMILERNTDEFSSFLHYVLRHCEAEGGRFRSTEDYNILHMISADFENLPVKQARVNYVLCGQCSSEMELMEYMYRYQQVQNFLLGPTPRLSPPIDYAILMGIGDASDLLPDILRPKE